jgi:hypothetical protein
MADKQPSTGKLTESSTDTQQKNGENKEEVKKLPQLGALEDDDEFEVCPLVQLSKACERSNRVLLDE